MKDSFLARATTPSNISQTNQFSRNTNTNTNTSIDEIIHLASIFTNSMTRHNLKKYIAATNRYLDKRRTPFKVKSRHVMQQH